MKIEEEDKLEIQDYFQIAKTCSVLRRKIVKSKRNRLHYYQGKSKEKERKIFLKVCSLFDEVFSNFLLLTYL